MASPSGNPNPSGPFELSAIFRSPSPNPNPAGAPSPYLAAAAVAPPPNGPFSYPPATPSQFHIRAAGYFPQESALRPPINFPPVPNSLPAGRRVPPLETAVSMPVPSSVPPEFPVPSAVLALVAPARAPSSKLPRGRLLRGGELAVHDVDSRLPGELAPPQLEVTPITKYTSDPGLVLGRQIAVNRSYIVYGLKLGNIRVLNINTALRSLLRGHSQRVTDMAFFAEDVHLLASASVDGRIFVWKIDEGPGEENKPQITGKIVTAIQIVAAELYHPRVCWHSHKQEILYVGVGNYVLRVDTTKVGKGKEFTAEDPLECHLDKLIDGVHLVGKHDGDVTDLSISQWMTTRLASASKDGLVMIWDDRKAVPLSVILPHGGQPVHSVTFLMSPNRPDHINLITSGPLNRELKIWASTSEEGWLLPSDSETWQCTQTVELISSAEPVVEEAFFNQVAVVPEASLILLANAKKNAIYAVHVDYGQDPASTCMDYFADFTVAMPILSLTGTYDSLPGVEQVVQVYCVQTMAIQQYALELSLCSPPMSDYVGTGRDPAVSRVSDSRSLDGTAEQLTGASSVDSFASCDSSKLPANVNSDVDTTANSYQQSTPAVNPELAFSEFVGAKPSAPPLLYSESDILAQASSAIGSSNIDLMGTHTVLRSPSKVPTTSDHGVDLPLGDNSIKRVIETEAVESRPIQPDSTVAISRPIHLITPSDILSGVLPSDTNHVHKSEEVRAHDMIDNSNSHGDVRLNQNADLAILEVREKAPNPVEIKPGVVDGSMLRDVYNVEELQNPSAAVSESLDNQLDLGDDNDYQKTKEIVPESFMVVSNASSPVILIDKEKILHTQTSGLSSTAISTFNSSGSNEPGSSTAPTNEAATSQFSVLQNMLQQLLAMHMDLHKQLATMIAVPVSKECKRIETALGLNMEKIIRSSVDALQVRYQEESAKQERAERERMQQISTIISNCINKDLPANLERALKKEISALGPVVARALTPAVEKSISSAVSDSVQKGLGDKMVNQLDKSISSKFESTVQRQIQAQFNTTGKQVLQDALRSSLESSIVPAFEQSCKKMFEQVESTFQKGIAEHTVAVQQQVEAANTPLALTLRDTINSASSMNQNLATELLDGQRKLLALVAAGNSKALNPAFLQASNGPISGLQEVVEVPVDPTKELNRLISERKYEEAFTMALQRSDVTIVSWLCSQVDLHRLCSMIPLPLTQGVLLALLQQLACDIGNNTSKKVQWMTDVAVAINPADPTIAAHVRPIFEQVYNILAHQRTLPTTTPLEATNFRLIMHVINSVLLSYK